jgi:hypothetical protein
LIIGDRGERNRLNSKRIDGDKEVVAPFNEGINGNSKDDLVERLVREVLRADLEHHFVRLSRILRSPNEFSSVIAISVNQQVQISNIGNQLRERRTKSVSKKEKKGKCFSNFETKSVALQVSKRGKIDVVIFFVCVQAVAVGFLIVSCNQIV